jgi:hypothetical protein
MALEGANNVDDLNESDDASRPSRGGGGIFGWM